MVGRSTAKIQIRDYRETDRSFVVSLSDETHHELRGMDPDRFPPAVVRDSSNWFERGLYESWARRSLFLLAQVGDEPAGFILAGPTNDSWTPTPDEPRPPQKIGEVYELHVAKAHRRKGVGSALLDASERELARQGFAYVTLVHLAQNSVAAQLYAASGYRPRWVVQEKTLSPTL
ncbi:MAG: GNAT family N-acetyltransferase [Thermoplasmata archaeon]|nr:GNAT family N-acetyltransferase [Thermoplasmata archaeon]